MPLGPPRSSRAQQQKRDPRPDDPDALRLFVCNLCQSIDELPTFAGPPDEDVLLGEVLQRHGHKTLSMFGERPDAKIGIVWRSDWSNDEYRKQIVEQIRNSEGHTGLGDEFYATRDFFSEEATKCYSKHGRPTLNPGCIDYRTKAKELGNSLITDEELRELSDDQRRNLSGSREKLYLCDYCPYQSLVDHVMNERNE